MTASSPGAGARGRPNRWNLLLGLLIGAVVIIVLIWLLASGGLRVVRALIGSVDPVAKWFVLMAVMAGLLAYIGRRTNGRWLGVLIDSTNTMSLSRLQVTLWTIMVLSAYLMLAWPRIFGVMAALPDLSEDDPRLAACRERLGDTAPSMDLCGGGALQIEFPPELVLAMGISLASFAGSHLIKNVKSTHELDLAHRDTKVNEARQKFAQADSARDQAADDAKQPTMDLVLARTAHDQADAAVRNPPAGANPDDLRLALAKAKMELDAALKSSQTATQALEQAEAGAAAAEKALETAQKEEQAARTQAEGVLHKNDSPDKASFHDIFRGNQITNYLQVDLGKVQMCFFTLVVLLAYGAAVAALLRNNLALLHPLGIGFPPFSDSLNALLALSHGTYLTVKAAAQS